MSVAVRQENISPSCWMHTDTCTCGHTLTVKCGPTLTHGHKHIPRYESNRVLDTSGNAVHRVAVHRGFDGKGGVRRFAERRAEREQGVFVVVYVLSLAEVASLQGAVGLRL